MATRTAFRSAVNRAPCTRRQTRQAESRPWVVFVVYRLTTMTAAMGSKHDGPNASDRYAFISYSRTDRSRVVEEVSAIQAWGFSIWIDDQIRPATEWPERIGNALQACSLFVLFVTANSIESRNVRNEVNLAIDEAKPVLAIHLEKTELSPGLRLRLGDIQAIHKQDLPADRYKRLLRETFADALGREPAPEPDPDPHQGKRRDDVDFGQLGL